MSLEVTLEPASFITAYARIPIMFATDGINGPYVKDYDAIPGAAPRHWPTRFDLSKWGLFGARLAGRLVGAAAVAVDTPGVRMLDGRSDLALLWDIRVAPEARSQGVGSALFRAAEDWARARRCIELKIETQDNNVAACRFYERHGCTIRSRDANAYPLFPHETQLLWYKTLEGSE